MTQIKEIQTSAGQLDFTQFWGGDARGVCLQLTQGAGAQDTPGYIQLTKEEAREVATIIGLWVDGWPQTEEVIYARLPKGGSKVPPKPGKSPDGAAVGQGGPSPGVLPDLLP